MNKDVKILLKKGIIFLLPVFVWVCIVLLVDPFNYFNASSIISTNTKQKSAQHLNPLLYNTINFKNNPCNSIIIGDSRIRKLPTERIKELTGDSYYTMHSNAAKLNEIIDLFWFCTAHAELKNVLIGINFNLFNEYAYSNRVADVKELINNPLIYIFNSNTAETVYLSLKNEFFGIKEKPLKDRNEFWEFNIQTVAKNHYLKYKYPKNIIERLREMSYYCKKHKINLKFLIVPVHQEFHKRLLFYKLSVEEERFKNEIRDIATVIDFDYPNSITNNRACFGDPLHTTDSVSRIIVNEIFTDSLVIGRKL